MRRIVNSIFSKRSRAQRKNYFDAGFKSYENVFEEERLCKCTTRDVQRKEKRAQMTRRAGLFE